MTLNGVEVLETVLRDGAQSRDVNIASVKDALKIVSLIDGLGYADIIEAGFAGSHAMHDEIIKEAAQMDLHARVAAFGRTRAPNTNVDDFARNPAIKNLLEVNTPVVVIVYKSWDYQVPTVGAGLEENLRMLDDTIRFFAQQGKYVIADAEFATGAFLGKPQKNVPPNLDYLLQTLRTAKNAGASSVVLCDTTGILLPQQVSPLINAASGAIGNSHVGFHGHNDHGVGDANNYLAMLAGATHVQTSFLGHGERTGNINGANMLGLLSSPYQANVLEFDLARLKNVSEVVHLLLTGQRLPGNTPFIGRNAFTHKGGMHADGNGKLEGAYNGRDPEEFGNQEHYPITRQSGRAHVAQILGVPKKDPWVGRVFHESMKLLDEGYQLDQYPEFFRLVAERQRGSYAPPFRILAEELTESTIDGRVTDKAIIKVVVNNIEYPIEASGAGLVDATMRPLEEVLRKHYDFPKFDFRYGVKGTHGAGSSQDVLAEVHIMTNGNGMTTYTMPGVSPSVIQASIKAITAGMEYMIMQSRINHK